MFILVYLHIFLKKRILQERLEGKNGRYLIFIDSNMSHEDLRNIV